MPLFGLWSRLTSSPIFIYSHCSGHSDSWTGVWLPRRVIGSWVVTRTAAKVLQSHSFAARVIIIRVDAGDSQRIEHVFFFFSTFLLRSPHCPVNNLRSQTCRRRLSPKKQGSCNEVKISAGPWPTAAAIREAAELRSPASDLTRWFGGRGWPLFFLYFLCVFVLCYTFTSVSFTSSRDILEPRLSPRQLTDGPSDTHGAIQTTRTNKKNIIGKWVSIIWWRDTFLMNTEATMVRHDAPHTWSKRYMIKAAATQWKNVPFKASS